MFSVVMPYDFDGVQQVRGFGTWENWRSYIKRYAAALAAANRTATNGRVVLQTPCKDMLIRFSDGLGGGW